MGKPDGNLTERIQGISKELSLGYARTETDKQAALKSFSGAWGKMKQFHSQMGADEFFRLDHIKKWSEKIISNLAKTVPHDIELSGRYKDAAIRKQLAIFSELLQYFSSDRIKVRKIHAILATLQYDPDNQDAFNLHYQAALNATPEWGEGYTEWASVLESDSSSTVRRKAIEILKQGLEQPLLEEGEWMRIRILEQLIHRLTKERRTENLDEYRKQLIKLRLAESRR